MPIDTVNKRRSAPSHPATTVDPVPDGAITAPDRRHVAWLYAGIASSAPVVVTVVDALLVSLQQLQELAIVASHVRAVPVTLHQTVGLPVKRVS